MSRDRRTTHESNTGTDSYPDSPHDPQSRAYYKSLVLSLSVEQLELLIKKTLKTCRRARDVDSVGPGGKRRAQALAIARLARHSLGLQGRIVLPFMIQALTLFKQGVKADELRQAILEAGRKVPRPVPRTLFFFRGWVAWIRTRVQRWQQTLERERAWVEEKRQYRLGPWDGPQSEGGFEKIGWMMQRALAGLPRAVIPT